MIALCCALGTLIFNIFALALVIKSGNSVQKQLDSVNDQIDYLHELGNKREQQIVQIKNALKGEKNAIDS